MREEGGWKGGIEEGVEGREEYEGWGEEGGRKGKDRPSQLILTSLESEQHQGPRCPTQSVETAPVHQMPSSLPAAGSHSALSEKTQDLRPCRCYDTGRGRPWPLHCAASPHTTPGIGA